MTRAPTRQGETRTQGPGCRSISRWASYVDEQPRRSASHGLGKDRGRGGKVAVPQPPIVFLFSQHACRHEPKESNENKRLSLFVLYIPPACDGELPMNNTRPSG